MVPQGINASGETRTEATINQHFTWKNLRKDVHDVCSKCDTCQRIKVRHVKYGKIREKVMEITPWETLCVDLIGPYTIKQKQKDPLQLWEVTMIDPATG